jgi:hypothetical protein
VTALKNERWFVVLPPHGAARAVGEEIIKAFSRCIGADSVKSFDCKTYLQAFSELLKNPDGTMVVDLLNHAIIVQCLDFKATNILVLALCPVTLFTLNLLKNQQVRTVHWLFEDFRVALYWKEVIAGYDFFFAIQKGSLIDECRRQQTRYAFLPTAAVSFSANDGPRNFPDLADVAFIGFPSPYRISFLEFLASRGVRLAIAGAGWKAYRGILDQFIINRVWTNADQTTELLSNAAIGINLSINDPNPDRENTHISPRVFDVLSVGCVLVTEDVPLVHKILRDCKYYVFSGQEQSYSIIKELLLHHGKKNSNAEKNRQIIRTRHMYDNRVREMIAVTQKI